MRKFVLVSLLFLPLTVSAYGNRNWLSANQHYSENISDNSYSWGYNYRAQGRHSTVRLREDRLGYQYTSNHRNHSAPGGGYHWRKYKSAR